MVTGIERTKSTCEFTVKKYGQCISERSTFLQQLWNTSNKCGTCHAASARCHDASARMAYKTTYRATYMYGAMAEEDLVSLSVVRHLYNAHACH